MENIIGAVIFHAIILCSVDHHMFVVLVPILPNIVAV